MPLFQGQTNVLDEAALMSMMIMVILTEKGCHIVHVVADDVNDTVVHDVGHNTSRKNEKERQLQMKELLKMVSIHLVLLFLQTNCCCSFDSDWRD